MRLLITDPRAWSPTTTMSCRVRAEDASGGFGILDGHADLMTVLTISVVAGGTRTGAPAIARCAAAC